MKIAENILDLVGNTPLVKFPEIVDGLLADIVLKLEFYNPGGSVKDRIGLAMIEDAEKRGTLKPGMKIIEPTSGNTGIAIAMVAAAKGYEATLIMPDTMSLERRQLLKAYGAEVILTAGMDGMKGAIDEAEKMLAEDPKSFFMPRQFDNPANPLIHEQTTAKEIYNDTDGKVDVFIAGVGTGGSITGISNELKRLNNSVYTVAVEPSESPVLAGGEPGPHKIQGIGAGFKPEILNLDNVNEILSINAEEAFNMSRLIAKEAGILVGISSGANIAAAVRLARREEMAGRLIVTLAPSCGERYLSTPLFAG